MEKTINIFLRWALALAFLSAVADRFGFYERGFTWGNFDAFIAYTGVLNPYASGIFLSFLAYVATALEVMIALFLILNLTPKYTALASAFVLFSFALSMSFTVGLKAVLDYSVLTGVGASLLLFQTSLKEYENV